MNVTCRQATLEDTATVAVILEEAAAVTPNRCCHALHQPS